MNVQRTKLGQYPAYRPSGVPWLGDVPEHWAVRRLKHWVGINESVLPETTASDFEFRYLEISAVGTGILAEEPSRIRFADAPSRARRIFSDGDTVISTVRTYLKAVWFSEETKGDLICSTGFAVLTPKRETVPRFVGYVVQSDGFTDQVTAESVGIAYPAIAESQLGRLQVCVPPADEQAAIVCYLDHADERISHYVSAKERLIVLLEEERQAVIHQAITRGLDPNAPLKPSGVPWLGDVPAHWDVRRAKYLYRVSDDRSLSGTEELMSVSHITGVTPRKQSVTMFLAESNQGYKICNPGDIVVNTMWAYMAALGVSRQIGMVSPSYGIYRPIDDSLTDPEYFDLLLRTDDYRAEYNRRSTGITASRLRLYPDDFLDIPLLCPPLDEQGAIVKYLDRATAETDAAIARARRQIELVQEYRTRLIADAVTGQIDVRRAVIDLPE